MARSLTNQCLVRTPVRPAADCAKTRCVMLKVDAVTFRATRSYLLKGLEARL